MKILYRDFLWIWVYIGVFRALEIIKPENLHLISSFIRWKIVANIRTLTSTKLSNGRDFGNVDEKWSGTELSCIRVMGIKNMQITVDGKASGWL